MATFRHIVLTELLEHGSSVSTFKRCTKLGVSWTEVTPERPFSLFEFDSKVRGAQNTPVILFEEPAASFELMPPKTICYCGFPSTQRFLTYPLALPGRFQKQLRERATVFTEVKAEIASLNKLLQTEPTSTDLACALTVWRNSNDIMLPFMFMSLMSDELVLESLTNLANACCDENRQQRFQAIFRSPYAAEICSKNQVLSTARGFVLPFEYKADNLYVPTAEPAGIEENAEMLCREMAKNDRHDMEVFFNVLASLGSILFQLAEESYYVWQSYALHINCVLHQAAKVLLQKGEICVPNEILTMSIRQINDRLTSRV